MLSSPIPPSNSPKSLSKASDDELTSLKGIKPLPKELTAKILKNIHAQISSDEFDFHLKVLQDAKSFLLKKIRQNSYDAKVELLPAKNLKQAYIENKTNEDAYERMYLDIQNTFFQKTVPSSLLKRLVSDLNEEFNLNRRLGLFILEKSAKGYNLMFNPNPLRAESIKYTDEPAFVFRKLAADAFHPLDRLNDDEIFDLHMENSLLETVMAKIPSSYEELPFFVNRPNQSWGLQTWIYDPVVKQKLINEVNEWNSEYNVEKRVGVFRHQSYGPYVHLWFQASVENQAYQDLKTELLSEDNIAKIENKFDIVYDNRLEWIY